MYVVIDGLSNMSGRNRFAVNDHSEDARATPLVHAARGDSHIRSTGTAASSGEGRHQVRGGAGAVRDGHDGASREERAGDRRQHHPAGGRSLRFPSVGRSRIAAMTFSRLSRMLVSTTVRNAITNPAAKPLTMLVRADAECHVELLRRVMFHWFMIVSAMPTTPRPTSAPTTRPSSAAISA